MHIDVPRSRAQITRPRAGPGPVCLHNLKDNGLRLPLMAPARASASCMDRTCCRANPGAHTQTKNGCFRTRQSRDVLPGSLRARRPKILKRVRPHKGREQARGAGRPPKGWLPAGSDREKEEPWAGYRRIATGLDRIPHPGRHTVHALASSPPAIGKWKPTPAASRCPPCAPPGRWLQLLPLSNWGSIASR
jgi:hypothetical protein